MVNLPYNSDITLKFSFFKGMFDLPYGTGINRAVSENWGLVSEETVVLRRWGSETRKFGLSTELIM